MKTLNEIFALAEKAPLFGPYEVDAGGYICTADERETSHGKMKIEIAGSYRPYTGMVHMAQMEFMAAMDPETVIALVKDAQELARLKAL